MQLPPAWRVTLHEEKQKTNNSFSKTILGVEEGGTVAKN